MVELVFVRRRGECGKVSFEMGILLMRQFWVIGSHDSLYIHNVGSEFRDIVRKGTGYMQNKNSKQSKKPDATQRRKTKPSAPKHLLNSSFHRLFSPVHYSSQGKSASSTLVQVKYPSPAGPKAVKSSSRKFLMSGLTASLAKFFTSSTRLSNLLRLSLE